MKHASVLNLILDSEKLSESEISNQITKSRDLVTEGRYLITVFNAADNWKSRIPVEGLVIANTLGLAKTRSDEWEFYGNGAVRCYKTKSLKLSRTYQWNIVRKTGDKPFVRRSTLSAAALKRNVIPVTDKVFTRDVANNVWHLKDENIQERLIARFSALLAWQDEEFILVTGSRSRVIAERSKLLLGEDLVGVPTKVPYFWKSEDVLF